MITAAIQIRKLAFLGPEKDPATVEFRSGLNIVQGATDTGKSFIALAIDFMLGARGPLPEIPERLGYDTIVMHLSVPSEQVFTLQRSTEGHDFLWKEGRHDRLSESDSEVLKAIHNVDRDDNLSHRLLKLLGIGTRRIQTKAAGDTRSLSFRDLAYLAIVDEVRIYDRRSPVLTEAYSDNPTEKSVFKLALTGVDDSAVVAFKKAREELEANRQQRVALANIVQKRQKELPSGEILSRKRGDLTSLESNISELARDVQTDEEIFANLSTRRRKTDRFIESAERRLGEIDTLLYRFDLLEQHYTSDQSRLEALAEASAVFDVLHPGACPYCGAAPEAQKHQEGCEIDPRAFSTAATAEIKRIGQLRSDLSDTRSRLDGERRQLARQSEQEQNRLEGLVRRATDLSHVLRERRRGVGALTEDAKILRTELRQADFVEELERDLATLDAIIVVAEQELSAHAPIQIPTAASALFTAAVQQTIDAWRLPDAERIQWDQRRTDIILGQRQRGDRGKGLRAITCAAFLLTLLQQCRKYGRPHAGFAIVDSPLLAYSEPDGTDDDLRGTDVEDRLYRWIIDNFVTEQVIVIENKSPPSWVSDNSNLIHFTRNPKIGRFGFFPPLAVEGTREQKS